MLYVTMFVILLIIACLEFTSRITLKSKKFIAIVITGVWVVLSTFQAVSTDDTLNYKVNFDYIIDASSLRSIFTIRQFEPLYQILNGIVKYIYPNFYFFQFVEYMIVAVLQYKCIFYFGEQIREGNRNQNGYELTGMFLLWALYKGNITMIRNTNALWICLYSIRHIREKKLFKFIICVVIAAMFHQSAWIFIPAYFIYNMHLSFRQDAGLLIMGTVIGTAIMPQVLRALSGSIAKISMYLEEGVAGGVGDAMAQSISGTLLKAVMNIGVLLLVCWLVLRLQRRRNDGHAEGYVSLYMVGCLLYLTTMFMSFAFARIAIYYNTFQLPLIMYYLREIRDREDGAIWWIILISYLAVRFGINQMVGYVPYKTIFS